MLALATVASSSFQAPPARPHLVFFMADDTGWNNVGWHNSDMKTPNADALVTEGVELDRHYAFVYCSPSRSSLMTGRLPYHVQQINRPNCDAGQGVQPLNMTFLPAKLAAVGYQTFHVGKWHLGMSTPGHIPKGRGFSESLVYFEGAEDHNSQRSCQDPECMVPIPADASSPYDLWVDDHPATTLAGVEHSGFLFGRTAVGYVQALDLSKGPMFMYLAPASSHTPLEPPPRFLELYPEDWYLDRRQYAGLCSLWDEILGNVTSALRQRQMWNTTLLAFSSDNGGPVYWSVEPILYPHGAGANNWPLLGGKTSAWEGGVRVAAFVAGGWLPQAVRGTKLGGYAHIADWYGTFARLGGADPTDSAAAAAGLPPVDSVDLWPMLSGANTTSPRTEMALVVDFAEFKNRHNLSNSVLISGKWKLLEGVQTQTYYQGPAFPNASSPPYGVLTDTSLLHLCRPACLYDILDDPTEQHNVAAKHLEVVATLRARLAALRPTKFQPESDKQELSCQAQVEKNGDFYGPWLPVPK